jgi:hypothetical protein
MEEESEKIMTENDNKKTQEVGVEIRKETFEREIVANIQL